MAIRYSGYVLSGTNETDHQSLDEVKQMFAEHPSMGTILYQDKKRIVIRQTREGVPPPRRGVEAILVYEWVKK